MRRQTSILPYQPAPISPTRVGLPLIMSSASAPSADTATEADTVWRNRRRLMLKLAPDVESKAVDFMWGSMNRAPYQCNHLPPHRSRPITRSRKPPRHCSQLPQAAIHYRSAYGFAASAFQTLMSSKKPSLPPTPSSILDLVAWPMPGDLKNAAGSPSIV